MKIQLNDGTVHEIPPQQASVILKRGLGTVFTDTVPARVPAAPVRDSARPAPRQAPRTALELAALTSPMRVSGPTLPTPSREDRIRNLRALAASYGAEGRRAVEGNQGVDLPSAVLPRAAAAYEGGLSFPRRAVAGMLDVASLPGRALAALPHALTSEQSYAESLSSPGAPSDTQGAEAFAQDVVRDPLNAVFATRGIAGPKTAAAVKRMAPASVLRAVDAAVAGLEGLGKAGKAGRVAQLAAEGTGKVGVPVASANVASLYASGSEDPADYALGAGLGLAAGPVVGVGIPAAKAGARAAGRKVMAGLDALPNPFAASQEAALRSTLRSAAASGRALPYDEVAGIMTEPTVGAMVRRTGSGISDGPMRGLARKLLREQMKPAPVAKQGQEVNDLIEALNTPGMFDELVKYRDVVGGVSGMAERGLERMQRMNEKTWNPVFNSYEGQRQAFNEAVAAARKYENRLFEKLDRELGLPKVETAQPMPGVRFQDVANLAKEELERVIREKGYAGSPRDLLVALKKQLGVYGTPVEDAVVKEIAAGRPYKLAEELPIGAAHRAKSNQFAAAYKSGDPLDPQTQASRFAAGIVGRAHNAAVDAVIARLEQAGALKPLPVPRFGRSPQEVSDVIDVNRMLNMAREGAYIVEAPIVESRPAYELQKAYLTDPAAQLPPREAFLDEILRDPANANVLSARAAAQRGHLLAKAESEHVAAEEARRLADLEATRREIGLQSKKPVAPLSPSEYSRMRQDLRSAISREIHTDDGSRLIPLLSEPVERQVQAGRDKQIAAFVEKSLGPWLETLPKYKSAGTTLADKLADVRRLDQTMAPWYKAEAALERAARTGGNRYSFSPSDVVAPLLGGTVGYAAGKLTGTDPELLAALGAGVGGAYPLVRRAARTPALPRLLWDIGSVSETGRQAATPTAAVKSFEELVAEAVDRLAPAPEGYDRVEPDTASVKVAKTRKEKK